MFCRKRPEISNPSSYLRHVSTSSSQLSFEQLEHLSEQLRALGHPIRLGIVEYLSTEDEANVTSIHTALDIEQATASHHLRILRTADIVSVNRVGKSSVYSLSDQKFGQLLKMIT